MAAGIARALQSLCPRWALRQPLLGTLVWPGTLPILRRQGPRAPSRFVPDLWGVSRAPNPLHPQQLGLDCPAPGHLGQGISLPDTISLISFPLSASGEDNSFLFRGTLKASNSCLSSNCTLEQFSVLIHSASLRLPCVAFSYFILFFSSPCCLSSVTSANNQFS